jgi:outer membrane lipoprotein SlyB
MTTRRRASTGAVLASISAVALLANAFAANAQPASGYDQGQPQQGYDQGQPPPGNDQGQPPPGNDQGGPPPGYGQGQSPGDEAPPQGQYAPPPPGAENNGSAYDDQTQQYDRDYAQRYSAWAAQNCVDQRNNNTAAGAIIGGVLGSVLGSGIAGRGSHFAGAVVGGAVGATAGAAIGSSSSSTAGCPPGYVIAAGAPAFYYGGPVGPVVYAPGWYNPWFWSGGQWVYRPYRYWYWHHPGAWRRGYRPGAWRDRYHRW